MASSLGQEEFFTWIFAFHSWLGWIIYVNIDLPNFVCFDDPCHKLLRPLAYLLRWPITQLPVNRLRMIDGNNE